MKMCYGNFLVQWMQENTTLQVLCLHLLGKMLFPKVSQVCDKCDGKHPTEKCPFFPLERSQRKDAWVRETHSCLWTLAVTLFFATISPTSRWITDAKIPVQWAEVAVTTSCGHLAQTTDVLPFCKLSKNVEQPKQTSLKVLNLNSIQASFWGAADQK